MSDMFDDRRKALEDDYFRRRDQETLDKMRDELAAELTAKNLAEGAMNCPRCDGGKLSEITHDGVKIDRCNNCGGVWLDAGELEQLTKGGGDAAGNWLTRLWAGSADNK